MLPHNVVHRECALGVAGPPAIDAPLNHYVQLSRLARDFTVRLVQ